MDNSDQHGAPVVMETNPNYVNLFGSIESTMSRIGMSQTDFTMIKAGSFLKANGGYLVINALDALVEPGVWPVLKRTLRNQIFEIQNFLQMYLFTTARLKPEPIKADVKVVMIGDAYIYNLLYFQDEDFKKIFKIKAEFDSEMDKADKAIGDYVRFIKKICDEDDLLPLDKEGIGALIEYATRIAGRQKKLSTRFHIIADVIREASYWARKAKKTAVGREDVEKAIDERFERVSLIEDKIQEMIEEGTILIDTAGRRRRPGQRPVGLRHGPVHVRQAGPHHRPDGHGPGRGHQHRARGRHERPDPQQGRPHPRRLPAGKVRHQAADVPDAPRWPSSSPTAASTATAPPRPRSTPSCRACPGCPSARTSPSRARSTRGARSSRSAGSTRRSRASSTSARPRA